MLRLGRRKFAKLKKSGGKLAKPYEIPKDLAEMEKTRLPLLELSPASAGSWLRRPPTPALHPGLNLPGWRWGALMQTLLVAVSRPLHSGVCETRQDAGHPVIHSAISDSGCLRTRGN